MRDECTAGSKNQTDLIPYFTKKIWSVFFIFLILFSSISISQAEINLEETNSYIIEFTSPNLLSKMKNTIQANNKTNMLLTSSFLDKIKENLIDHQSAIEKIRDRLKIDVSISSYHHYHFLFNGIKICNISQLHAQKIAGLPFVKRVQQDSILTMQNTLQSQSSETVQSSLAKQDTMLASNLTLFSGHNVSIAFFDSGIDYNHPALQSQYNGGYDFVNKDEDPFDDNGHGTHVIGITAAKALRTTDENMFFGVAPNASVYAYKLLDDQGQGYTSDFLSAFELAMDPNQDGNISDHIDIISISAGNPEGTENDVLSTAADQAVKAGICVVAAAGNNGPDENTIHSPASNSSVIAVGASITNDMLASYSSRGSNRYSTIKPDVIAPGHEIISTWPNNQSRCLSGTSMATPYVSGLIARMLERNNDLQPAEIKSILQTQTTPLGHGIFEEGYGLINPPESFLMKAYLPIEVSTLQQKNSNAMILKVNSSYILSEINYTIRVSPTASLQSIWYQKQGKISLLTNNTIHLDLDSISSGLYVISLHFFDHQSYAHIKQIVFFEHINNNKTIPSTVIAGDTFSTTLDTKAVYLFIVPFRSIQIDTGYTISFKAPKIIFTDIEYINASLISIPYTFPIRIERHSIKILNRERQLIR